ncbi:twin-arginine translocase subunit TatC [Thalassiella azotivora]
MALTTPRRRANPDGRMPLREHLRELRNRSFKAALGLLAGAVAGWFLYDPVLEALTAPLEQLARESERQVSPNFSSVAQAFDLKVKIAVFIGVLVSAPVWIYQLWAFITPGLTRRERRYALAFVASAVPLFLAGSWLAFQFLPNAVRFLVGFTPEGFSNVIDAQVYLGFVMRIILAFGLSFLVPVVLVALNFVGLVTARSMVRAWRWVVVVAFTFAAMATPTPDVLSMFVLALPLLGLFALAIGVAALNDRRRARRTEDFSDLDDDTASVL